MFAVNSQVVADRGLELLSATFIFSVIVGATFLPQDPSDLQLLCHLSSLPLLENYVPGWMHTSVVLCTVLWFSEIKPG
jgi:hypothetical protein